MRNLLLTLFIIFASAAAFANPTFLKAMPQSPDEAEQPAIEAPVSQATDADKALPVPNQTQKAKKAPVKQLYITEEKTKEAPVEKIAAKPQEKAASQAVEQSAAAEDKAIPSAKQAKNVRKKALSVDEILKQDPDISLKEFLEEQKKAWQEEYHKSAAANADEDTDTADSDITEAEALSPKASRDKQAKNKDLLSSTDASLKEAKPLYEQKNKAQSQKKQAEAAAKQPVKTKAKNRQSSPQNANDSAWQETEPPAEDTDGEPTAPPWNNFLWGTLFVSLVWGGIIVLSKYQ